MTLSLLKRAARSLTLVMLLLSPSAALAAVCQTMAIPAYFDPGALWTKAGAAAGVEIKVMNPDSGVGRAFDPGYLGAVQASQAAGVLVIGYVYTSYGARSAADILTEIATYMAWYGVDGIFLDEVSSDARLVLYYRQFADAVHREQSLVVLNPGTYPAEDYMHIADVVLTFEGGFDAYRALRVPAWVWNHDPSKFWHLIYGVSSSSRMKTVLRWAQSNNVGYMYVTNDRLNNPWDTLPSYFAAELGELAKTCQ
jgi:Spherulation-specific family 4